MGSQWTCNRHSQVCLIIEEKKVLKSSSLMPSGKKQDTEKSVHLYFDILLSDKLD